MVEMDSRIQVVSFEQLLAAPGRILPATPIGIAISQPAAAMPQPHVVYNPTPPVKPVAKKSMSCLSLVGLLVLMSAAVGVLAAGYLR